MKEFLILVFLTSFAFGTETIIPVENNNNNCNINNLGELEHIIKEEKSILKMCVQDGDKNYIWKQVFPPCYQ